MGPANKRDMAVDMMRSIRTLRPFVFWRMDMEPYAVIETGGKQHRVEVGAIIDVESIEGDAGAKITLDQVLAVSDGSSLKVGAPLVAGATVKAEIIKQFRGEKVVSFRKLKRKGFHKKKGHRQEQTQLKIEAIA